MSKKFFKTFIITLLICTLIFAGVGVFYLSVTGGFGDLSIGGDLPEITIEKDDKLKENDTVTALLMGVDKSSALTDTIMFVKYNLTTNRAAVISIIRDTWVDIPGVDHRKINSVYSSHKNGAFLTMEVVSSILNESIDYYVTVDLKAFENIVDIIGGVTIDVPKKMYYHDPVQDLLIDLKPGVQTLRGKDALGFVRFRKGYADQDLGRVRAQQQFIQAFLDKLISPSTITKAPALLSEMGQKVKTNMSPKAMSGYIKELLTLDLTNIEMLTIPGEASNNNSAGAWYYYIDETKTKEMMENVNKHLLGIEDPVPEIPQGEGTAGTDTTGTGNGDTKTN